ncbi:hypothetical protein B0H21DRAFT_813604 [Amylocystis lapponica]|nr:hypothetical protein B0H21DRAFT_813604 [Amylocystis lapponica]
MQEKYWRLEENLRESQRELAKQHDTHRKQASALAEAERRAAALRSERDNANMLLKTRTEELRAAEVYLTKTDAVSDADVRRMVESLNAEIYQSAALIADTCQDQWRNPNDTPAEYPQAIYDRLVRYAGHGIIQLLRQADGRVDSIQIQIALQCSISSYAHDLVTRWSLDPNENTDVLGRVYNQILRKEPQAVTGRWRMLTRQYTRALTKDVPDMASFLMPQLAQCIADVLFVAGIPWQSWETVSRNHGERLKGLVTMMLDLRNTIGEYAVASHFELIMSLGHEFDPTTMEDGFGEAKHALPDPDTRVLCTTELGLRRWERVSAKGKDGEWTVTVALKSKVVLDSITAELAPEKAETPGRHRGARAMAGSISKTVQGEVQHLVDEDLTKHLQLII